MKIIRTIKSLKKEIARIKQKSKTIGFVPTMGALHEGHMTLIRRACRENDFVVVSIFVNPIQFGPREDFKKYPRNLKQDASLCNREKVDIIFYPDAGELYPENFKTYVEVSGLGDSLCGEFRPGHFRGVTTVVTKLFNLVNPDIAYFGQKDAQQSIIIKKMVEDLNMPIKIKVLPTIREKDGLAMSSRNLYLSDEERKDAVVLFQALNLAADLIKAGMKDAGKIIKSMKGLIKTKRSAKIDYASIVDTDNLEPIQKINKKCLIALAVRIGKTRLIDNTIITP
jgi:pantoate--beta-alanine ligase